MEVASIARECLELARQSRSHTRDMNQANEEIGLISDQFDVSKAGSASQDQELLHWNEAFMVQVPSMDSQHLGLFEAMNRLYQAVLDKSPAQLRKQRLDELLKLATQHFADEERVMEQAGYPELRRHKQEHARLLAELDTLMQRNGTDDEEFNMELLVFLKNWLLNHISKVDKQYSGTLRQAGIA